MNHCLNKIIIYLSIHDVVGNEIFKHSLKENYSDDRRINRNSNFLDDAYGYCPFYFYIADYDNNKVGDLGCVLSGIYKSSGDKTEIEDLYNIFEYMFHECQLPLDVIFRERIKFCVSDSLLLT